MTPITIDAGTALLVVDVQNDFADARGALYVSGGDQVIPAVNQLVAEALRSGALVVYTQDWHPPNTPHFAQDGGVWPVHCVRETWGAALHPQLRVAGPIVRKGIAGEDGYSGFFVRNALDGTEAPTELEALLRARKVTTVIVVGLATDYCVLQTALDAQRLGFHTVVLAGATRAVERVPGDGQRALAELRARGVDVQ